MGKEKDRSLVLSGAKLGRSIIGAAVDKARKDASDKLLDYTADLMRQIEHERKFLKALEEDLAAIEAGEFTISGETLVYHDPKRGQAHIFGKGVVSCPRCGGQV